MGTAPQWSEPLPANCELCSFDAVDYDSDIEGYQFSFDIDDIDPSMAIIGAVSTVTGRDPLDLEPLQWTIDADALDTLFTARDATTDASHVRFTWEQYDITYRNDANIIVRRTTQQHS